LINKTPQKLVTDSSLLTNPLLSAVIKEKTGISSEELASMKMSTEQINIIYVELSNIINELEIGCQTGSSENKYRKGHSGMSEGN